MSAATAASPSSAADVAAATPTAAAPAKVSNAKPKRSALNVTGVHVLKAALISVLGAGCATTQSVEFAHATKGELTVSYTGETLSLDQFAAIEAKCNQLIEANLALAALELPKDDIATCAGPHAAATGELRIMKLLKMRNRKNQAGYEFSFVVHTAAEELQTKNAAAVAATNSKKTQAVQQAAVAGKGASSGAASSSPPAAVVRAVVTTNYVAETTQSIFNDLVIPAFAKLQSASSDSAAPAALTPAELASLKANLLPSLESYLVMFANQAYTRGFTAQKIGKGDVDLAALL